MTQVKISQLQNFLSNIQQIIDKNEEISRLKHESFNIFSILRKEHEEERLHSAFIAALLDVNGGHSMGKVFCELFVKQFVGDDFTVDDSVSVYVEKSVTEGRLDISIENGLNEVIVIENKIYARDQPKQLLRYSNYLTRRKCKYSKLFYLTLFGSEPDNVSIIFIHPRDPSQNQEIESEKNFYLLSYNEGILEWLESCIKEAVEVPTVRETIKQYILLIKKLTGQLTNQIMGQEVDERIKENFKAAKLVAANWDRVLREEVQEFLNLILDKVESALDEKDWEFKIGSGITNYHGVTIRNKSWDKNISIQLDGDRKICYDPSYLGLYAYGKEWDAEDVKAKLPSESIFNDGFVTNENYPYLKNAFNFGEDKDLEKLFDAVERENLINDVSGQLIKIANACGDKFQGVKKASDLVG